jgi:peptidyl-prolyl cis-trans isomerase SurA
MRRLLCALLVSAAPAAAQEGAPAQALRHVEVDRIVAVVGKHPILFSEVLEVINFERARGMQIPPDSAGQLRIAREILGRIVDQEVLVAVAKDYKIEIGDTDVIADVDRRLDQVRAQFRTEDEYRAALRAEGFGTPEAYRRQTMDQAKKAEMQSRARDSLRANGRLAPVNVTEREVAEAFERFQRELPPRPATLGFRQIVITPRAREASRLVARLRLDSIRTRLEAGADFDSIARAVSQDPQSAAQGGDLGWNRRGAMVPEFDRMMFALTPGRISPIVETSYGYHVIRVDRVRTAEVRARHILIVPEVDSIDVSQARARADSLLAQWKSGVPYDSLMRLYHDPAEERNIPDGMPRDSLPAEYRVALRDVPLNGFTEPFALPAPGTAYNKWAVAQVTGLRPAGAYTLEEYQERIRQQLREEKSLRRTLDNLRRQYYVSLRL